MTKTLFRHNRDHPHVRDMPSLFDSPFEANDNTSVTTTDLKHILKLLNFCVTQTLKMVHFCVTHILKMLNFYLTYILKLLNFVDLFPFFL